MLTLLMHVTYMLICAAHIQQTLKLAVYCTLPHQSRVSRQLVCPDYLLSVQGAATSVYAATASELTGKSGAYLSNCNVATPSQQAQDAALAKKLWAVTEQQLRDPSART